MFSSQHETSYCQFYVREMYHFVNRKIFWLNSEAKQTCLIKSCWTWGAHQVREITYCDLHEMIKVIWKEPLLKLTEPKWDDAAHTYKGKYKCRGRERESWKANSLTPGPIICRCSNIHWLHLLLISSQMSTPTTSASAHSFCNCKRCKTFPPPKVTYTTTTDLIFKADNSN